MNKFIRCPHTEGDKVCANAEGHWERSRLQHNMQTPITGVTEEHSNTHSNAPKKGEPLTFQGDYGPQTVIPTYVALSKKPASNGACHTADVSEIDAAGWYVEYHYPDQRPGVGQHRRFIPFDAVEQKERPVVGDDYDPAARWEAGNIYALELGVDVDIAQDFADYVGGDGGERAIAKAWRDYMEQ